MTKRQAFVIVPINYEYNDEVNYASGYEKPDSVYFDRAAADQAVLELTMKYLRGLELSSYAYSFEALTINGVEASLQAVLEEILGEAIDTDNWYANLPQDLTLEQTKKLMAVLGLSFYEVQAVTVDG